MSKRVVAVAGVAVVGVMSVVSPALGGPSVATVAKSVKTTAEKALKKAKKANKQANANKQAIEDLRPGPQGPAGPVGQRGPVGPRGPAGTAEYAGPHWGIIDRNTIGSAVGALRSGPFVPGSSPPFGDGSLGLQTSNNAISGTPAPPASEKISFGNEVDFIGDKVGDLAEVGFRVFTTGENLDAGAPMPNITFEIDPNLTGGNHYSSMVFIPDTPSVGDVNKWSDYIDATSSGEWFLTGSAGGSTGCNTTTTCTFDELQTALADGGDDAIILTAAVAKGRDSTFAGAVDGLRINDTVYDFEPFGVNELDA